MARTITARVEQIDFVAATLLTRAARVSRMFSGAVRSGLSRTEAGLLATVATGPRRITDLARTEALAQPTVTKLVDGLENRGLVMRERSDTDGRVVLVAITAAGLEVLEEARAWGRSQMRALLSGFDDEEVTNLAFCSETLQRLLEALQTMALES